MARRKGLNPYKIIGDTTILYITTKDNITYEVFIDTEDLPKLKELNLSWTIKYSKQDKQIYARATKYLGKIDGKYKNASIYLHIFVLGIKTNKYILIDHKNHNTLDDRKNNLRVIHRQSNDRHRNGKNSNNKSGYRNVSWISNPGIWRVQLMIDGKNTKLRDFPEDQVHEAGKYAQEMREKYYGEFAGVG